jgi:hypothetical protein
MSSFFGENRDVVWKSTLKKQFRVYEPSHFGALLILDGTVSEGKTKGINNRVPTEV